MTDRHGEAELEMAARWASEVAGLFDRVIDGQARYEAVGFAPVSAAIAARILAETGLDVGDCQHVMDSDGVRHIMKTHGLPSEALRGQIPLVREDFVRLIEVLQAPDTITTEKQTRQGSDTIFYTKTIGGFTFFYVEGLRRKKRLLSPVTFYKRLRRT